MTTEDTPAPQPMKFDYDANEVVNRLRSHPVVAPYVEGVLKDIALEQLLARNAELEAQVASAGVRPSPPPAGRARPAAPARTRKKPSAK